MPHDQVPPNGLTYYPHFLNLQSVTTLTDWLAGLSFEAAAMRGRQTLRRMRQFGFEYKTTGRTVSAAPPWPTDLAALITQLLPLCPAGARFDQCIATMYPNGAGIGWHTDAACFGDTIAAVSLGGPARLQFRPNGAQDCSFELAVAPGSLYVMTDDARRAYQHRVIPVHSTRYSLTFRSVLTRASALA